MSSKPKQRAQKYFEEKKFYNMSPEERIKQNNYAFEILKNIPKEDYEGTKKLTKVLGGKYDS